MKKYTRIPYNVEAVQYQKDKGLEDGYLVYETEYPEDGHYGIDTNTLDTTRHTVISSAIYNYGSWVDVYPGDYIVIRKFKDGEVDKKVWKQEKFEKAFILTPA